METKKELKISFKETPWTSALLTNKIYKFVEEYNVELNIQAKHGSLEVVMAIVGFGSLILQLQDRFTEYMREKRRKEREKLDRIEKGELGIEILTIQKKKEIKNKVKIELDGKIEYL